MKPTDLQIGDIVMVDVNAQSDYEFDNVNYQPCVIESGEDIDYAIESNMNSTGDVYIEYSITQDFLMKNGFKPGAWDSKKFEYWWADNLDESPHTSITFTFYAEPVYGVQTLLKVITKTKDASGVNDLHMCNVLDVNVLQHAIRLLGINKTFEI